jgi:hypothetical protein
MDKTDPKTLILDVADVDWEKLINPSTVFEHAVAARSEPDQPASSVFANYADPA